MLNFTILYDHVANEVQWGTCCRHGVIVEQGEDGAFYMLVRYPRVIDVDEPDGNYEVQMCADCVLEALGQPRPEGVPDA